MHINLERYNTRRGAGNSVLAHEYGHNVENDLTSSKSTGDGLERVRRMGGREVVDALGWQPTS